MILLCILTHSSLAFLKPPFLHSFHPEMHFRNENILQNVLCQILGHGEEFRGERRQSGTEQRMRRALSGINILFVQMFCYQSYQSLLSSSRSHVSFLFNFLDSDSSASINLEHEVLVILLFSSLCISTLLPNIENSHQS